MQHRTMCSCTQPHIVLNMFTLWFVPCVIQLTTHLPNYLFTYSIRSDQVTQNDEHHGKSWNPRARTKTNQVSILKPVCCYQTKDKISRTTCIRRGVRHGCIISPILFNLHSEYTMKEIKEESKGIIIGGEDDAVTLSEQECKFITVTMQ